jgi:hypothetical protein
MGDILIAAPGDTEDHRRLIGETGGQLHEIGQRVGAFEGRDDPFQPREELEGV